MAFILSNLASVGVNSLLGLTFILIELDVIFLISSKLNDSSFENSLPFL